MNTQQTFAPLARFVTISDLNPGDEFMDLKGNRMVKVDDRDQSNAAVSVDTHEIKTYSERAKAFVCKHIVLKGKSMILVRSGDRVVVEDVKRQSGVWREAIGKTGIVHRNWDPGTIRVILEKPLNERCKSVFATAVTVISRPIWS